MARRGGLMGKKLLSDPEIDGFIQSMRDAEAANVPNHIESPRAQNHSAGGYPSVEDVSDQILCARMRRLFKFPPGLCQVPTPSTSSVLSDCPDSPSEQSTHPSDEVPIEAHNPHGSLQLIILTWTYPSLSKSIH